MTKMNTKHTVFASIFLLTGCATTQQPLRQMHIVADGWVVAAYDKDTNVHLHARKLQSVPYTNKATHEIFQLKQVYASHGETLQSISEREYGSPYLWDIIAMANNISSPYILQTGQLLDIPQESKRVSEGHVVQLDQWELRMVNSSGDNLCARVEFMDVDYYIDVQPGWFHTPPYKTLYLGRMTQEPWELADQLYAFDDAKWVVNTLTVVPYEDQIGCDI